MDEKVTSTEFYAFLVREGHITKKQLAECLNIQQELRGMGLEERSVLAILLEKKYLTREKLTEFKENSQEKENQLPKIPGYEVERLLGEGGMGAVYLARQISMDRNVAIKILPKKLVDDFDFVARFTREARASAALNHRNIVGGIDVGEANGIHYFVMEYVEGKSVGDLLEHGPLTEKKALDIVYSVALALKHANNVQMVHRDIKPDNLMISKNGEVKLLDFGLAKKTDGSSNLTRVGATLGTPYYLSPEQASGDETDIRSDIYSLGATLFHLVTGTTPFDGKNPLVIMTKHINDPVPPPQTINPIISDACVNLIYRMMEKYKERRFQTPDELLEAIEKIRAGTETSLDLREEEGSVKEVPSDEYLRKKNKRSQMETIPLKVRHATTIKGERKATTRKVSGEKKTGTRSHERKTSGTRPTKRKSGMHSIENERKSGTRPALGSDIKSGVRLGLKRRKSSVWGAFFILLSVVTLSVLLFTNIFMFMVNSAEHHPSSVEEDLKDDFSEMKKNEDPSNKNPIVAKEMPLWEKKLAELKEKIDPNFSLAEIQTYLETLEIINALIELFPEQKQHFEVLSKNILLQINVLGKAEFERIEQKIQQLPPENKIQKTLSLWEEFPITLSLSISAQKVNKAKERVLFLHQEQFKINFKELETLLAEQSFEKATTLRKKLERNCLLEEKQQIASLWEEAQPEEQEKQQKIVKEWELFIVECQKEINPLLLSNQSKDFLKALEKLKQISPKYPLLKKSLLEMQQMITSFKSAIKEVKQFLKTRKKEKKGKIKLGEKVFSSHKIKLSKLNSVEFVALLEAALEKNDPSAFLVNELLYYYFKGEVKNLWKSKKVFSVTFPNFFEHYRLFWERKAKAKFLKGKESLTKETESEKKLARQLFQELLEEFSFTTFVQKNRKEIATLFDPDFLQKELRMKLEQQLHGKISILSNQEIRVEYNFIHPDELLDFEVKAFPSLGGFGGDAGEYLNHPKRGIFGYGNKLLMWKPLLEGDVVIEVECIPVETNDLGCVIHRSASIRGHYAFVGFTLFKEFHSKSDGQATLFDGVKGSSSINIDILEQKPNLFSKVYNSVNRKTLPEEEEKIFLKFSRKKSYLSFFVSKERIVEENASPFLQKVSSKINKGQTGVFCPVGALITKITIQGTIQRDWLED